MAASTSIPSPGDAVAEVSPARDAMDRIYRYQRRIYDPTRKFFLLGRDHLVESLQPPSGGHVIELGCGTARNLIAAAMRYPEASFYGLDVSDEMLASARTAVRRAGLTNRIAVAQGDATSFDPAALFGRPAFDRAFFSYSLSMMPPWRDSLDHALTVLVPNGRLHVVDFGQQEGLPSWFRSVLFAWLSRFHVSPRADMHLALARAAGRHRGRLTFRRLYRGYAWYGELGLTE